MKITSLLLSSAALVVAGSAFAADLPAKKAAPAQFVKVCDAFGAGFFTIPGGDTCIKLSGRVTADTKFSDPDGKRTASAVNWGAGFRLNVDVKSNTDAGVLRGYGRIDNGNTLSYAYIQLGGFTAGLTDTAFAGYNGDNTQLAGVDDGAVLSALQYTASLGAGTSVTLAVEDASKRQTSSVTTVTQGTGGKADTTTETVQGASQIPDLVANIKTTVGAASFQLSAATHQNYGLASGSKQGYAVQAYGKFAATPALTLYAQGTYADGALSYLGYGDGVDYTSSSVDKLGHGWSALLAAGLAAGPGSLNLIGSYGTITSTDKVDTKITQLELNYGWTVVKNLTVTPAILFKSKDNGTKTDETSGRIRIQRDF